MNELKYFSKLPFLQTAFLKIRKNKIFNIVEELGRESLLGDAFIEQLAELNTPNLTYVQFDFHEYWYFIIIIIIIIEKNILNA